MNYRRSHRAPRTGGFTLVEVVVSLALGALLLVAVQALVVRSALTERLLRDRALQSAQTDLPFVLLHEDLASRPLGAVVELTRGALRFDSLNALQTSQPAARQPVAVTYRLEPDDVGAFTLMREERARTASPRLPIAVTTGLTAGRFEVFDGQKWSTEWRARDGRTAAAVALVLQWSPETEEDRRVYPLAPPAWTHHRAR